MDDKQSHTSYIFISILCLFAWAGVWATGSSASKDDFRYWSYFDRNNVALQHILDLSNEEWTALDNNHYRTYFYENEFWDLADNPILWIKIQIPRRLKDNKLWIELVPNTGVDGLLVQKIEDRWQWLPAEGRRTDNQTALPTNYLTFPIDPTVDYKVAYLKLNTSQVFNFSINIHDYNSLAWDNLLRHLLTGLVLGAIALAFCYNIAIGMGAGERIYMIYSSYIASMFVYILVSHGYFRIIFPEWGGHGLVARSSVYVAMYCALAFAREFFNVRHYGGLLDTVLRIAQIGIITSLIISLFINDFYAFVLNDTIAILSISLGLLVGGHALRRGHPLAKLFLLAWIIFLAGSFVWSMTWIGLTEPTTLPPNLLLLGTAIEVGLLSLILSYRYSFLKETSEKLTEQYKKYQDLSELDELTGLMNRRGFFKAVELELRKHNSDLVWLTLDIDHFKKFNDEYGHLVGDKLLAEFGNMLSARSRREEFTSKLIVKQSGQSYRRSIVGRMGGEEFSILLVNTNLNQAKLYADRLLKEFAEMHVFNDEGEKLSTTLSIGGCTVLPTDTIDSAWKRSDTRLYEAKTTGRSRAVMFD